MTYLPELGTNLVAALPGLDVHDFPHDVNAEKMFRSRKRNRRGSSGEAKQSAARVATTEAYVGTPRQLHGYCITRATVATVWTNLHFSVSQNLIDRKSIMIPPNNKQSLSSQGTVFVALFGEEKT